jgi:PEP-CTERM motif-containing protein/lectin family protein
MKLLRLLLVLPFVTSIASAAPTTANFDGAGDSVYTLQTFGEPGGPSVQATGGNPGGFLQLTPTLNSQNNWVTFDRTDVGPLPRMDFGFNFRFDNLGAGGADGFSFNFYATSLYGITGGVGLPLFTPEDPAAAGVLGIGFDTWGNSAPVDAVGPGAEFGPDYSEISLFWNGGLVVRVDDTRQLPAAFNLKDGAWHRATGTVDFQTGRVSMSVDDTPIWVNLAVPGLVPFESRVGFAGRTGGANERTGIDGLNVVPEPTSMALLGVGGLLLLLWRRRRS